MKPPTHFDPRKIDVDGALSTWYKQLEVWKSSRTLTQTVMATKPSGPTLVELSSGTNAAEKPRPTLVDLNLEKLRRTMIEFNEKSGERVWFGKLFWRCPNCKDWFEDSMEVCSACGITRGEKPLGLTVPMIKREPHVQD